MGKTKAISIRIEQKDIVPMSDINGVVTINYSGRFDGVQVNTYIMGASEQVRFVSMNNKPVSLITRLYMRRDDIHEGSFKFTARIEKLGLPGASVRFRAAIIQEHKEVESDTIFVLVAAQ